MFVSVQQTRFIDRKSSIRASNYDRRTVLSSAFPLKNISIVGRVCLVGEIVPGRQWARVVVVSQSTRRKHCERIEKKVDP